MKRLAIIFSGLLMAINNYGQIIGGGGGGSGGTNIYYFATNYTYITNVYNTTNVYTLTNADTLAVQNFYPTNIYDNNGNTGTVGQAWTFNSSGKLIFNPNQTLTGTNTAAMFIGDGAGLTNIPVAAITGLESNGVVNTGWTNSESTNYTFNRVGIGTNSPQAKVHIVGNGSEANLLQLGTTAADSKLVVTTNGNLTAGNNITAASSIFVGSGSSLSWNIVNGPTISSQVRGVSIKPGTGNGTNHFQVTDTNGVPVLAVSSNNVVVINTSGTNVAGLGAINFGPDGTNASFYTAGTSIYTPNNFRSALSMYANDITVSSILTGKVLDNSVGAAATGPQLKRMSAPYGASWQIVGGDGASKGSNHLFVAGGVYVTNNNGWLPIHRSVTNYASATDLTIYADRDERSSITNAVASNITLLITNCVPGVSGRLRFLCDGSARTISVAAGPALTVLTNALTGYGGTNFAYSANQRGILCWDVSLETPTSTNVAVWAINQ